MFPTGAFFPFFMVSSGEFQLLCRLVKEQNLSFFSPLSIYSFLFHKTQLFISFLLLSLGLFCQSRKTCKDGKWTGEYSKQVQKVSKVWEPRMSMGIGTLRPRALPGILSQSKLSPPCHRAHWHSPHPKLLAQTPCRREPGSGTKSPLHCSVPHPVLSMILPENKGLRQISCFQTVSLWA